MRVGFNYPWAFNAYGGYFGAPGDNQDPERDAWLGRWVAPFKENLRRLDALGVRHVRLFLLCNGYNWGTLRRYGDGHALVPPAEVNPRGAAQLAELLDAFAERRMQVILSFTDFLLAAEHWPSWGGGGGRYDAILRPLARRRLFELLDALLAVARRRAEAVYAFEIMNEPCWVTRWVSPPTRPPKRPALWPHAPTVSVEQMSEFLADACRRVERAGLASSVGHRFLGDLARFPTGTLAQLHYYAQVLPTADPWDLPRAKDAARRGGGRPVFLGEIGTSAHHGRPWPALRGRDAGDTRARVRERLRHAERKGWELALLWPDRSWSDVDPTRVAPEGRTSPLTWEELRSSPTDPLGLSDAAEEGVRDFLTRRERNHTRDGG